MPDLIQGVCFVRQLKKLLKKDGERGGCFRNANMFCHVLFMYLEIINDSDVYRKQSLASWSVANYDSTCLQPSLIIILYYKVWILSCMSWQPQNWKLPTQATEWLMHLQGSCPQWRRQARPQGKYSSLHVFLLFLRVVWNVSMCAVLGQKFLSDQKALNFDSEFHCTVVLISNYRRTLK